MATIRSYVRRQGRLSVSQKQYLLDPHALENPEVLLDTSGYAYVGLEIGFGMGDSLMAVGRENPDQMWLGVEVYPVGLASVIRQIGSEGLSNIRLYQADVHDVLLQSIPIGVLDHVRIFFPDPWPKTRHQKRRLIQETFLDLLASRMKSGAIFHCATDDPDYARICMALIDKNRGFCAGPEIGMSRPETKFSRKALKKGHSISDIVRIRL